MDFRHQRIDDSPPCADLCFTLPTDLTGDGYPDVIIGGHGPHGIAPEDRADDETNLFWYENPGPAGGEWTRHAMTGGNLRLSVGGALHDFDGDGRVDVVAGQNIRDTDVYWFRQPADPRERWEKRLVTDRFQKYHDLAVGDVDDDGEPELLGCSQDAEAVFYFDLPDDPTAEPWDDGLCTVVDEGLRVEGLAIADVDGDGETEILAGTNVYHRVDDAGDEWAREEIATGWDDNRVAVADLDGDGDLEIVYTEGDSPEIGTHMGRLAWFDRVDGVWEGTFLHEDLMNPHTLQVGDVTGTGTQDIYLAEMGIGGHEHPKHYLFANDGDANFDLEIVAEGVATHEARLVDLNGNGRLDLVGKNYGPEREVCHVDVWWNEG